MAPIAVGLAIVFLTPVIPWVDKLIFPLTPPDTKITSVTDGNNLKVLNDSTTPSNPIMFKFTGKDNVEVSSYECSIDGGQFSYCKSPYINSPKVGNHSFSVRSVDNEGTYDPTPAEFELTITATVEGVVKIIDKPVPYVDVIADKKYKDQTIEGGTFILENVPYGKHIYEIFNQSSPLYRDKFSVLADDSVKDLGVINVAPSIVPVTQVRPDFTLAEEYHGECSGVLNCMQEFLKAVNDAYISKPTPTPPINILYNESQNVGTPYHSVKVWINGTPQVLSEIERVTYYLHPTFKPDVITKYSLNDKFGLSFNAWGQFELKAKAYFRDGRIEDVSKKIVFGSTRLEDFNPNFPTKSELIRDHPPTVKSANIYLKNSAPVTLVLNATDRDEDDVIRFVLLNRTTFGSIVSFNQATGEVIYAPNELTGSLRDFFVFEAVDRAHRHSGPGVITFFPSSFVH